MIIRKTRDGYFWLNNEKVSSTDVVSVIGELNVVSDHFEANTEDNTATAFVCVNNIVNQIKPTNELSLASSIALNAEAIIAARETRIEAEISEEKALMESEKQSAYNALSIDAKREIKYIQEYTISEFMEAVMEFLSENRREKLDVIQAKREAVKSSLPK